MPAESLPSRAWNRQMTARVHPGSDNWLSLDAANQLIIEMTPATAVRAGGHR